MIHLTSPICPSSRHSVDDLPVVHCQLEDPTTTKVFVQEHPDAPEEHNLF